MGIACWAHTINGESLRSRNHLGAAGWLVPAGTLRVSEETDRHSDTYISYPEGSILVKAGYLSIPVETYVSKQLSCLQFHKWGMTTPGQEEKTIGQ